MVRKDVSTAVKIDTELLEKVEKLVNQEEHKYRFTNKKHFIDLAVFEFLKKFDKGGAGK